MASCGAFVKSVAAAGTPERLISTPLTVGTVLIQRKPANSGSVFIGGSNIKNDGTVGFTISSASATALHLMPANGNVYSLHDMYVDAASNGEGVEVFYTII